MFKELIQEALERRKSGERHWNRVGEITEKIRKEDNKERSNEHIHISAIAKCSRMIYYERLGFEPEEGDQQEQIFFDTRKAIHEYFQVLLYEYFDFIEVEKRTKNKELNIGGRMDFWWKGKKLVADLKTRNMYSFKNVLEMASPQDIIQLQGYQLSANAKGGSLLYFDMNDKLIEYEVKPDKEIQQKIKEKCRRIENAVKEGKVPENKLDDCIYCRYEYVCKSKNKRKELVL